MKKISKRYASIFKKYYAKKAEERFFNLLNFIELTMKSIDDGNEFTFYVDEERLSNAIDSYFLDIIKYKEYHFNCDDLSNIDFHSEEWCHKIHAEKLINASKVAAFSAKWFLKASPIAIIPSDQQNPVSSLNRDVISNINSYIALQIALYALLGKDYSLIDIDSYDALFYDFKYRNFDERAYFARFDLLLDIIKHQKLSLNSDTNEAEFNSSIDVSGKVISMPKEIKVFVSSASDVDDLRKISVKVMDELNNIKGTKVVFDYYLWETDKESGFLKDDDEYMKQVFNEFGKWCDVFLIIFWARLGKGTLKEYEHFKNTFLKENPAVNFKACEYGKKIDADQADEMTIMNQWVKVENAHWSPMNKVRKSIKNPKKFEAVLRQELLELMMQIT